MFLPDSRESELADARACQKIRGSEIDDAATRRETSPGDPGSSGSSVPELTAPLCTRSLASRLEDAKGELYARRVGQVGA
jgi:hypothetical protein